ncbi:MAG TPA: DUF3006 domain-containing protein [Myxococcales bacterium]|jgi:hypothetical protein
MPGPFVDRIEGKLAVLVVDGEEEKVPLSKLPKGVKEGVYLTADRQAIDSQAAEDATKESRERRERLQKKDGGGGGDFSL